MKFLKADGTVEEGIALTDKQADLRDALEKYLHRVVCDGYHSQYETPKCCKAANYLAIIFTTIDKDEFGDEISDEIERLTNRPKRIIPEPRPEPAFPEPPTVDDLPL